MSDWNPKANALFLQAVETALARAADGLARRGLCRRSGPEGRGRATAEGP